MRPSIFAIAIAVLGLLGFGSGCQSSAHTDYFPRLSGQTPQPYSLSAGFYVNWYPGSFESLKAHIHGLNCIIPEWYAIGPDGASLVSRYNVATADPQVKELAKSFNVPIIPLIHNIDGGKMQWERLRLLLSNPVAQKSLAESLRDNLLKEGYAGINVDFEPAYDQVPPDKLQEATKLIHDGLPKFIQLLRSIFHPVHLVVTQDVMAESATSFDYETLGRANDFVIVMLYDQHVAYGIPGPIASQAWVEKVTANLCTRIKPQKLVLGLGNYCYDWPVEMDGSGKVVRDQYLDVKCVGPGKSQRFGDVLGLVGNAGSGLTMDAHDLNPYFTYSDKDHKPRLVYLLDAVTAYNEVMALAKHAPRGAAVWYLGSEDPALWSFFAHGKLGKPITAAEFERVGRKVTVRKDGLIGSETYVSR